MLRRELDWIPRKAMEKNPEDRYATASDLAAEIDDFLDGRPITAAGQRRGYRFRKTLQRHKFAFAASLLVLLSLVGGVVATSLYAAEANKNEAIAKANEEEANRQRILAVENEARAREIVDYRQRQKRDKASVLASGARGSLEQMMNRLQQSGHNHLRTAVAQELSLESPSVSRFAHRSK